GGGGASASPANMLAEILADTYGEEVKRTTGLDILQLESGAQQAGSQDLKITVGEKLTRRLTVKYSVETSNSELTRTTTAEYKLLENILLNGFQDSKGTFGGDVQFRLEFR
ncbi:MAG TPA: translocation/assembly module TamB domain-containing protein, partial [Deltaproteobacteria bacterium]|nr:translocation/assembly module TamB domain-containing protein [Deltaproteobacteria bacterium]